MREYLLVFLVAAASTYLLTVIAREIALRTGAVAAVRDRDVHAEPIPYLGGLAMLGGLVAAYLVARELPFLSRSDPFVFRDAAVVLAAGALICAVGVLDDIFDIDALTKLGGQVLAAGLLVYFGVKFYFLPDSGGGQLILDPAQGALMTVVVVIATVNAVNFVDGLDGLASGVVGIGACAFFLFCYQLSDINGVTLATTGALLSAALAGACAGFLPHNFNPARLFMGDSGSMLIGLVLSASALTLTGQFDGTEVTIGRDGTAAGWVVMFPLLLPVSLLLVPMADLVLAVVRRTRAGRSPFAPDKQHLHHRLLEIGHSQRRAVFIMWTWAALLGFGGVVATLYSGPAVWAGLLVATLLAVGLTFLLPNVRASVLEPTGADGAVPDAGVPDAAVPDDVVSEGGAPDGAAAEGVEAQDPVPPDGPLPDQS
ncbi:glycosyltransferase family 4 protein [Nocardioides campestrisoli]|uniref:glycosyltransferase family 4 protein n=1 Tax=Nocardioides campestrisoli TaxID=2736757 RepID=UPI0015E7ABA8|nr:MraY family glycosyltransferase [Nocardioides campestrisoli]